MSEGQEQRALTPEERRRNVRRVQDAEAGLAQVEQQLIHTATSTALTLRTVRTQREEMRKAMQLGPLPPLAPVFQASAEPDEAVKDVAEALHELAGDDSAKRRTIARDVLLRLADTLYTGQSRREVSEPDGT